MNDTTRSKPSIYSLGWIAVLCLAALFTGYKILNGSPFYTNLMELLPKEEQNPVLDEFSHQLARRFQDRFIILIKAKSPEQGLRQTRELQSKLLSYPGFQSDTSGVQWMHTLRILYQPFLSRLLTSSVRNQLQTHSAEQLAGNNLQVLLAPIPVPRPYAFQEDPFNLGGAWLNHIATNNRVSLYRGCPTVVSDAQRWFIVSAKLDDDPFNLSIQKYLSDTLEHFRIKYPSTQILTSGMVFHTAEATQQAKREMRSVGLGSLTGIILVVILVFRSAHPLGLILIVLGSACLVALSVSLLVFGRIHLLTLAFGSTLLGISVDYAFHFLIRAHLVDNGKAARQHIQYALAAGALTSIAAYLMQLLTPFPGLQQMAVFSASGLLGAWLTVLCCGDFYKPDRTSTGIHPVEQSANIAEQIIHAVYRKRDTGRAVVPIILLVLAAGCGVVIVHFGTNDDITSLNTSSRQLLNSEQQVQRLLQRTSSNRFFLVKAPNDEILLQRLENLHQHIRTRFPEAAMRSISDYVPSLKRQEQNLRLTHDKLFRHGAALDILCGKLAMNCQHIQQTLLSIPPPMLPKRLLDSPLAELLPPILTYKGSVYSLMTLNTAAISPDILKAIARQVAGVRFVDQGNELSSLLARYRKNVSFMLLATLVLIIAAMIIRYRSQAWRVLVPLHLSLAVAMACAAMGGGITIFHLAALLLVLGIGVDAAIFYLEVGLQGDSWLASSLASLTSVLAFGLLSLSEIPVLQQFGVVIFSGILFCWLVTPLFFLNAHHRID